MIKDIHKANAIIGALAEDILEEYGWDCELCTRTPNKVQCDAVMCINEIIKDAEKHIRYDALMLFCMKNNTSLVSFEEFEYDENDNFDFSEGLLW